VNGEILEGIYLDMPNDVYHSLNALSSSAVKKFMESPAAYFRLYRSSIDRKRTLAQKRTFDAGSYGHELCLEPQGFYERYFRDLVPSDIPDSLHTIADIEKQLIAVGLPAKEGRKEKKERCARLVPSINVNDLKTIAEVDAVLESNGLNKTESKIDKAHRLMKAKPDAIVFDYVFLQNRVKHGEFSELKDEQGESYQQYGKKRPIDGIVWDDAHRVQSTVREHSEGSTYLSNGLPEVAIFSRCPITGMMLKVKFDWLRFDDKAVDLKTTLSAKPDDFRRQIQKLHYDIQGAFYTYVASLVGITVDLFCFVAVEYIHADICQPYTLSRKTKIKANMKLQAALKEYKACDRSNIWYGYQKEDCTIELE
jgi:exodeoxyribonuclease VIII